MNGAGFSAIARVRLCGAPPTPTGARDYARSGATGASLRPFPSSGATAGASIEAPTSAAVAGGLLGPLPAPLRPAAPFFLVPRALLFAPAVLLGLGEQGLRPLDGDREDLVLGLEAAALLALLQVGAVATVVGGDLVTVGVGAHLPRQSQQLERVLERNRVEAHGRQQRRGLRLLLTVDELAQLDVRPVATVAGDHVEPRLRVLAEHLRALGGTSEQLDGEINGELVGRDVVGERRALVVAFEVRAELADPHVDRPALVVLADLDRVDLARVDLGEVLLADELLEPALAVPEVEVVQPVLGLAFTVGDVVERLFHRGGEVVVHEVREVPFHELELGERRP